MVPRAVLMKSSLVSLNTAKQVNIAHLKIIMNSARPMTNLSKLAHSTVKWPIHKNTTFKNSNFNQRVNTVKDKKFNTTRPKEVVNVARPKAVVNVVKGHNVNAVKASACWTMKKSMEDMLALSKPQRGKISSRGKFDGKADEGFFVGYSINSKAFRVFNSRTRIFEENLHVQFSENTPNIAGSRLNWLFDIDALTKSMNYKPVVAGNHSKSSQNDGSKPSSDDEKKIDEDPRKDSENIDQEKDDKVNSTNNVNAASTNEVNVVGGNTSGNGYPTKGRKIKPKMDKTEHGMEEREKDKVKSNPKSTKVKFKVNPAKSQGQSQSRKRRNVKWAHPYPSNGLGQPI
ncbi:hypothetical protein Tco_0445016 [Tanacetum coccineum]